jgi:hypothetical protein
MATAIRGAALDGVERFFVLMIAYNKYHPSSERLNKMSTEQNIRLRTKIAAKVLPELIRYYVEANGKLPPDSKVKADLFREALSYADGLMEQARSNTTPSDTGFTVSNPITRLALCEIQDLQRQSRTAKSVSDR